MSSKINSSVTSIEESTKTKYGNSDGDEIMFKIKEELLPVKRRSETYNLGAAEFSLIPR